MQSGDIVKLSDKCLQAIVVVRQHEEDAYTAFTLAVAVMKDCRAQMVAIVREHHPELKDHEFTIRHKTGDVMATFPVDWRQDIG